MSKSNLPPSIVAALPKAPDAAPPVTPAETPPASGKFGPPPHRYVVRKSFGMWVSIDQETGDLMYSHSDPDVVAAYTKALNDG